MEDIRELKNGLGIASLVLGIIGFLTGFIFIGIILDLIAIVLGIVAIVNKNYKNALAIAGTVIAVIGLILTLFVFGNIFGKNVSEKLEEKKAEVEAHNKVVNSINEAVENGQTVAVEDVEKLTEKDVAPSKFTFGDVIEVGDFYVVFNNYGVVNIDNQFADVKEALVVSTSITNKTDETQDMLLGIVPKVFTPTGVEAGDKSQIYLNDDFPCYWHDKLRSGATYEGYLVCDYAGDGEYVVELTGGLFTDPVEVFLDITKEE